MTRQLEFSGFVFEIEEILMFRHRHTGTQALFDLLHRVVQRGVGQEFPVGIVLAPTGESVAHVAPAKQEFQAGCVPPH